MFNTIVAIGLTFAPGLYAFVSGRVLLRDLRDPALDELYFARNRRVTWVTIFVMVLLAFVKPRWAPALLPVLLLGVIAGGFPTRRTLFEEDWGLASFLSHTFRLLLGMYGPWLLLLAGPIAILLVDAPATVVGGPYVLALVAWGLWGGPVLLWSLGARPLADATLIERFSPLIASADCVEPELYVTRDDGSRWANAFAVPRLGTPAVLFTHGLLRDLDADELTAILGHELAHLEEFQGTRWKRRALVPAVLGIGVATALGLTSIVGAWLAWAVPIGLLVVIALQSGKSQRRESDSDRRAVELTGDPEALARALEKIHARARIPRRMDAQTERRLTHPSLARRVQAIRALGGDDGADAEVAEGVREKEESGPTILRLDVLDEENTAVFLTEDRLLASSGVIDDGVDLESILSTTTTRSFPYTTLQELRVEPRGARRYLVFRTATGRKAERFRVSPAQVPDIQAWLDRVDTRLGEGVVPPDRRPDRLLIRMLGTVMALMATLAGAFGVMLAGVLVLALPRRPIAWMSAAVALVAGLGLATGVKTPWFPLESQTAMGWLLVAASALLIVLAERASTGEKKREHDRHSQRILAAVALVALLLESHRLFTQPSEAWVMAAHLHVRQVPDSLMLLGAAGFGMLLLRRRVARLAGMAVLLTSVMVSFTGLAAVRATSGDLLASTPSALVAPDISAESLRTVELGANAGVAWIRVDPGSGRLLAAIYPTDGSYREEIRVEGEAGWRTVDADQAAWGPGGEVVGFRSWDGMLFTEDADGARLLELSLGRLGSPELVLRGESWLVLDHDVEDASVRLYEGPVVPGSAMGGTGPEASDAPLWSERTVALPTSRPATSFVALESGLFFTAARSEVGLLPFPLSGIPAFSYGVGYAGEDGEVPADFDRTTVLTLGCFRGSVSQAVCTGHDGSRTEVWHTVIEAPGELRPVGWLTGWYSMEQASEGIILDDYRTEPIWVGGDPLRAVSLPTGAYLVDDVVPDRWREALDVAGDRLAVAWNDSGVSTVEVYRLR